MQLLHLLPDSWPIEPRTRQPELFSQTPYSKCIDFTKTTNMGGALIGYICGGNVCMLSAKWWFNIAVSIVCVLNTHEDTKHNMHDQYDYILLSTANTDRPSLLNSIKKVLNVIVTNAAQISRQLEQHRACKRMFIHATLHRRCINNRSTFYQTVVTCKIKHLQKCCKML